MEKVISSARAHIQDFEHEMTGVERITALITFAENNPGLVAEIYLGYYQLIKDLVGIDDKDREVIAEVNKRLGKRDNVAKFLEIVAGRGKRVISLVAEACNPDSNTYKEGIKELAEMMRNADRIKSANPGARPVDGDPQWDSVIWGYTNGADDPITDIHFVIAHGLCRVLSREFEDELRGLSGAEKKDWLLNAMTDVIALRGVRGQGREGKFYQQWRNKRPKGLGWISDNRDLAYRER